MNFTAYKFNELTNKQLYKCLELRFNVFVVEQECLYPEFDEIDENAIHILVEDNNEIIGYSRLYTYNHKIAKIGRIVIHPDHRNKKIGNQIVKSSISYIAENFNQKMIEISAQQHLENFYKSFGFITTSSMYLDYGIPHIDMQLEL